MNSDGVVAGQLITLSSGPQAYYGTPDDMKILQTTGFMNVVGISEDGRVAGTVFPGSPNTKPYMTGVVFERNSLKTVNANGPNVIGAISPNGMYIAGRIMFESEKVSTLVWLSTTVPPKPLNRGYDLDPRDVSDRGEVVGTSLEHAALWASDRLIDLNTRVDNLPAEWTLTEAVGISSSGDIAVTASDSTQSPGRLFPLKLTRR